MDGVASNGSPWPHLAVCALAEMPGITSTPHSLLSNWVSKLKRMFLAQEKNPQAAPERYHSGRSPPCTLLRFAQMPWAYQVLNLSSLARRCWATSFYKLCLHYIVKEQYVFMEVMNKFTYFHPSFLGFMKIPHSVFQPIHPGTIALCMYEQQTALPWNLVSLAAYCGLDLQWLVIHGHDTLLTSH